MSSAAVRPSPDYNPAHPQDRARQRVLDASLATTEVQIGHPNTATAMHEAIARVVAERPSKSDRVLEIANQEIDRICWLDTGVTARVDLAAQMHRLEGRGFSLALWVNALELVAQEDRDVDYERGEDPDAVRRAEIRRIVEIVERLGERLPARMPRRCA